MPSVSAKQARLMRAVAHGWKKPGGGGPSKSVAEDFVSADKGKKFRSGGVANPKTHHGKLSVPNFSGASMKRKKGGRKISGAGLAALAAQMGPPPGPPPGAGGPPMMPPGGGGMPPGMKRGGGVERKGTGRGQTVKMSGGGSIRGGGCETKGKTKGRFV